MYSQSVHGCGHAKQPFQYVGKRRKRDQRSERLRVIDWEQPANNDFLLVSQFSVNGLPLVVTELKKPGVPARAAFDENLTHYKAEIPQLFWFNALPRPVTPP
jgi:type I restriction enzyme R subunit